jgi:uncharacterized protein (UPF0548 family)
MGIRSAPLTYDEVGATRQAVLPAGYGYADREETVGQGRACFERAADGILSWRMHRGAGFRVVASAPRAAEGVVVVSFLAAGPVILRVPCRVVYVVDEPDRRGFAYGTLPGHPEIGEEAFTVRLTATGEVRANIRAFSRPGTLLTRAAGPLGRLAQSYVTTRYISALRKVAADAAESR